MDITTYLLDNPPDGDTANPILVDADRPGRSLTWRQYASTVKRIAVGLRGIGLEDGDCATLMSRNDILYYVLGDGIVAAGGIFCGVPASARVNELVTTMKTLEAKWIFAEPMYLDNAVRVAEQCGMLSSHVLVFDPTDDRTYEGTRNSLTELLRSDESSWSLPKNASKPNDTICFRYLTSGTTGLPKAADISHSVQISRTASVAKSAMPRPVKYLHWIALHHISGHDVTRKAVAGRDVAYITSEEDVSKIVNLIHKYEIEISLIAPRDVEQIVSRVSEGLVDPFKLASLKLAVVSGSLPRTRTMERFRTILPTSALLKTGYGSTEAGRVAIQPGKESYSPGFVGKPFLEVDIKIMDVDTLEEVEPGVEGEICVRSESIFNGYLNNPSATNACLFHNEHGTWLRMGDKGRIDPASGQIALTGRFKEIFKVGPEEVSPEDIEKHVMEHPSVLDAAAAPTPGRHNENDSECMVYVVTKDDSISAQQLMEFMASLVSAHKVPSGGVIFCDKIPRNDFGKVMRKRLDSVDRQSRSVMYPTFRNGQSS